MEISDEELVLKCRTGDEESWEILVNRYRRLIYTIPRRAGLDEDLAGEIFQEVFSLLVKHLTQIKQPSQIRAS
jgi:DNA-directed RNA polymerase specialized sigma24 family protein